MPNVQIVKEPKVIVPSQTIQLRMQDGKRIVQMFLADDSFTFAHPIRGKFRLNKQAVPSIAKTIIGKKYIIPTTLDHPQVQEPNPYDVNVHVERLNEAGKPYEAGTFFDIHPQNRYGNDGYDAFVEMDTDLGKRLFDAGLLPRYNSTSILKLNQSEPEDDVKTATINNVCAVKYPNYGIRSSLQGMCVGDKDECKTQLINNSVSGTTSPNGFVTLNVPCPTMEAIKQLPDEDKIVFDNTLFNSREVTHSDNSMSANPQPNLGTTDATVTYDFPNSKRTIKMDGKGKIISDTHPSDKLPEGFKGMVNPPALETEKRPEGNGEEGEGNGDNNKGGGEATKNANGAIPDQQQKTGQKEEVKKEEILKTEEKKEQGEPKEIEQPKQDTERIGRLETEVKELTRYKDDARYYRGQLIRERLSRVNMKQEQKDEDIKHWEKLPLHGEELEFALSRAYPSQVQEATVKVGERKNSAYIDDGTKEVQNSAQEEKPKKLTVNLLQRKQTV